MESIHDKPHSDIPAFDIDSNIRISSYNNYLVI